MTVGMYAHVYALPENGYVVPLCRAFSKDLFDLNAQPFLAPTVRVVNATSNAAFYHSAYVPRKVNKPYFRLSLNGMLGFVSNDMKTFTPQFPMQPMDPNEILKYASFTLYPTMSINIKDTVGLLNYLLQTLIYDGVVTYKTIIPPTQASTSLGNLQTDLNLPHDVMLELVNDNIIMKQLKQVNPEIASQIENAVMGLPENFTLFAGGDINTIIAGVPQLEVGSLFGTELLIRFVPRIDLGQYIGKFEFWGLGVKHSISQYFYEDSNRDGNIAKRPNIAPFDLAVQAVYQKTKLVNTVGVTKAELVANANIFTVNVHASKNFNNIIEAYTGISYDNIDISGSYTYTLPIEMQGQIGLVTKDPVTGEYIVDPPEYPGDTEPQTSIVNAKDSHIKWVLGVSKNIGPVTLYLDYSLSKFNVFSGGLQYRF